MKQVFALTVNGARTQVRAAEATPLLDVLRNELGLKAARFGCGLEQCGACKVLVDGEPAFSCTLPVSSVSGRKVTTLEGLGTAEAPHPLQRAFLDEQAGQCGYCLSGILISASALLAANPDPSRASIVAALDGHLCRCGAHLRIVRAIERAAAEMRAGAKA
jgi:nicotinate dehydrogenase subunit A